MKSTSQQEEFGAEFGALGLEALMPSTELSLCGSPGSSGAQGTFRTGKRCGGFGGWGLRTRLLRNLQKATGGSALASGPNTLCPSATLGSELLLAIPWVGRCQCLTRYMRNDNNRNV